VSGVGWRSGFVRKLPLMIPHRFRRFILLVSLMALVGPLALAHSTGVTVTGNATEPRTLVILGASYAKGWGTPVLPGYQRVINRGIGGEETGGMLRRFNADVVAAKADAVLIWGHVNNISRAKPDGIEAAKAAARRDMLAMVTLARSARIEVILATEIPWTERSGILETLYGWIARLRGKTSYASQVSAHVEQVNEYLRALAKRENLRLLDFGREFANEYGTRKPEYGAEDGSHISRAGYDALSAYARKELQRAK
jgi:lysophospholipase L1-like esterase